MPTSIPYHFWPRLMTRLWPMRQHIFQALSFIVWRFLLWIICYTWWVVFILRPISIYDWLMSENLLWNFYDSWNPWHSTSITNYQVQNQNWYKSQAQSVMWNRFHLNFYLGKGFTVLWLFVASIEIVSIIKFMKKNRRILHANQKQALHCELTVA